MVTIAWFILKVQKREYLHYYEFKYGVIISIIS